MSYLPSSLHVRPLPSYPHQLLLIWSPIPLLPSLKMKGNPHWPHLCHTLHCHQLPSLLSLRPSSPSAPLLLPLFHSYCYQYPAFRHIVIQPCWFGLGTTKNLLPLFFCCLSTMYHWERNSWHHVGGVKEACLNHFPKTHLCSRRSTFHHGPRECALWRIHLHHNYQYLTCRAHA